MAGAMTELMQCGPVPIDRLEIGLRRRHLHKIVRRVVEGRLAADAEIRAGGGDQRLGLGLDQIRVGGGARSTTSSGRPSHCAVLKTVKRFRNGMRLAPRRSPRRADVRRPA